jgi:hypothetical protein
LHPPYLLATTVAIFPTKLVSATFLSRISFVIIVGKRDIKKLFVLPSSQNRNNSRYHGKISQHLPLPLNLNPRHLSLPLRLSPPRVISIRMLKRRSTMLTKGRCFNDAPPSSLMDSTVNPQMKIVEGRVGARSLARNTSRVKGHVGASGWD